MKAFSPLHIASERFSLSRSLTLPPRCASDVFKYLQSEPCSPPCQNRPDEASMPFIPCVTCGQAAAQPGLCPESRAVGLPGGWEHRGAAAADLSL